MPDRFSPAFGLALALAALALGGCGSTHATTTTAATGSGTGTKAQFVAQAEAICRTLAKQEAPLRTRQESLKGLAPEVADRDFLALAREVVSFARSAEAKLAAIPPPAGERQTVAKLLNSYNAETRDATSIADAAAKEESTLGEDAGNALRKSVAATAPLAAEYGMKDCIGGE